MTSGRFIFGQRRDIMEPADLQEITSDMREQVIDDLIDQLCLRKTYASISGIPGFQAACCRAVNLNVACFGLVVKKEALDDEVIRENV